MPNDLSLLQRYVAHSDSDAFAELVRRYSGMVYGVCLRVTRDPHEAEDAAQECLLDLARNAASIKTSVAGWLHLKATSRATDALRRTAARKRLEEAVMSERVTESAPGWSEVSPRLDQAFAELPDELRSILLLHYCRGAPQSEIAVELGVNQSTVSRRLTEAIGLLRERLETGGVSVSAASLAGLLAANALTPAPPAVAAAALAFSGAGKVAVTTSGKLAATAFLVKVTMAAVVAVTVTYTAVKLVASAPQPKPVAPTAAAYSTAAPKPIVLAKDPEPKDDAKPAAAPEPADLIGAMKVVAGKWTELDGARVTDKSPGVLVSPQSYDNDSLVVEFDAYSEGNNQQGLSKIRCFFSPDERPDASGRYASPSVEFLLNGGARHYPWNTIRRTTPFTSGRSVLPSVGWGDYGISARVWYHVKAESIGKMQRLWVNDVPIRELKSEAAQPAKYFVRLEQQDSGGRFKNLKIIKADEAYIKSHAEHLPALANPYTQVSDVLAQFPDKIVREASIELGEQNTEKGLVEVPYKNHIGTAQQVDGVWCRHTDFKTAPDVWGLDFRVNNPETWNPKHQLRLEVEFLDRGDGEVVANYNAWTGGGHTEATPRTNSGKWIKQTLALPDAQFRSDQSPHFWVGVFQANDNQDLFIRSLRVIEVAKPVEAYQAVATELRRQLTLHHDDWTAPMYKLRLAQTLAYNLDQTKEAVGLMDEIEKDAAAADVRSMFRAMKQYSGAWQIGETQAKASTGDF